MPVRAFRSGEFITCKDTKSRVQKANLFAFLPRWSIFGEAKDTKFFISAADRYLAFGGHPRSQPQNFTETEYLRRNQR